MIYQPVLRLQPWKVENGGRWKHRSEMDSLLVKVRKPSKRAIPKELTEPIDTSMQSVTGSYPRRKAVLYRHSNSSPTAPITASHNSSSPSTAETATRFFETHRVHTLLLCRSSHHARPTRAQAPNHLLSNNNPPRTPHQNCPFRRTRSPPLHPRRRRRTEPQRVILHRQKRRYASPLCV